MIQFIDFSPVSLPSLDQQQDALQKGLGRAWMWASSKALADEPLLEACVRDMRYDKQCENSRGNWLWDIVQQAGAMQRLRDPIFEALSELADERSANQLCELGCFYAKAGDEPFRSRLYEIVETNPFPDSPWLGETEIIDLDGETAFLFAARLHGERLDTIPWDWHDESVIRDAIEKLGEDRIGSLLASSSDAAILRFYTTWREQSESKPAPPQSHRDRMRSYSVADIIEAVKEPDKGIGFRGWGMYADESDLNSILRVLWEEKNPQVICRLLKIFSNRSLPAFDARLIELCLHDDEDVRRWAFSALKMNEHAAVRSFAIQLLATETSYRVISLFAKNFKVGDEDRILESMALPDDHFKLHSLLTDVVKVLEDNPEANCSQLAVIAYASTPCQICRFYAARLLHQRKVAPVWLMDEFRYDSEEGCRQVFDDRQGE